MNVLKLCIALGISISLVGCSSTPKPEPPPEGAEIMPYSV